MSMIGKIFLVLFRLIRRLFVRPQVHQVDSYEYAILARDKRIGDASVTQADLDDADLELERFREFLNGLHQNVRDYVDPTLEKCQEELAHWKDLEKRGGKAFQKNQGRTFLERLEEMDKVLQNMVSEIKRVKRRIDAGVTEEEKDFYASEGMTITQEQLQSATRDVRNGFPEMEAAVNTLKSSYLITLNTYLQKSEKIRKKIKSHPRIK